MNDIISRLQKEIAVSAEDAAKIVVKAVAGGEITDDITPEEWFEKRFLPNCVMIDEEGYAKMCIDALKIVSTTAATDYGSSRQRDMGQLWADMTRGYLGEFAFKLFLKKRWDIESDLGHEKGELKEYLPMDIHKIRRGEGEFHAPKYNIGVKTTKWNGIWLDIPGDQFNHSDIHVLIKIGGGRDHLFAFFKKIGVFKEKILKKGIDVGSLTTEQAEDLYANLPDFQPVPAYVCGFVRKSDKYADLPYKGKKGRKHYNIHAWKGPMNPGDLNKIKAQENITNDGNVKFSGIGSFAHDKGYLFNTGSLLWEEKDWNELCSSL